MKTDNNFIRSVFSVIFSNIFILISGVLVGFILPKIMGVNEYGYYKLFMLYTTYIVLLYFGFADGMLVKYGGQDATVINKSEITYITRFFLKMEIIVSIVMFICCAYFLHGEYRSIFLLLSIFTLLSNVVTYYRYLAQAMLRFDLISRVNMFQSILTCLVVIICWLFVKIKLFNPLPATVYLFLFLIVFFILLVILYNRLKPVFTKEELIKGKESKRVIFEIFKLGIPVAISYQIGTFILNIDNQLISIFFNNRLFGIYSFAYSLISIISTIIVPISTVIFPFLNRQNENTIMKQYSFNTSILFIFVYAALIIYYPVRIFIEWYLPNYNESLVFFRLLLPGIGISSCISILVFNYYKVIKKSGIYLIQGSVILIGSIIFNLIGYYLTKSAIVIAIISLLILFVWYIFTNIYFIQKYKICWKKNIGYLGVMILVFEITTEINNIWLSLIIYIVIYTALTICAYHFELRRILQTFSKG